MVCNNNKYDPLQPGGGGGNYTSRCTEMCYQNGLLLYQKSLEQGPISPKKKKNVKSTVFKVEKPLGLHLLKYFKNSQVSDFLREESP